MLVLGLLLLLHHVWALLVNQNRGKELARDTNYVVKSIDSCPSVGYFFRRDSSRDGLGPCRLCFCKDNGTAVCWRRDNKRCDTYHYYNQHSIEKRYCRNYTSKTSKGSRITYHADRVRRSPGFTDIFFRDATRDFFNQQTPEQCKPYESSFSDDCPPADWCAGCTVCDCDANGRWDCHLLSFCPGKDNQYRKSVKKGSVKKNSNKKMTTKLSKVFPTRTTKTSVAKKSVKKGAEKKLIRSKNYIRNMNKKSVTKAKPMKVLKKASQRSSSKTSVYKKAQAKKLTTKKPKVVKRANTPNAPKKPIAVKRLVTTKKPRVLKVTLPANNQNNTLLLARRAAVRSYMKNLKKALSEQLRNMPLAIQIREKRSTNGNEADDFEEIDIDYGDDIITGYERGRRDVTIYTNHIGTHRSRRDNPDVKLVAIKTANGTAYLAKKVIKKVMTAIRRILNESFMKQKRSIVINNKNTKTEQTNDTKSSSSRSRSASMKKKLNKKQLSKEKARKKRDVKDTTRLEISNGNYSNPTESTQDTGFDEKILSSNSTSDYYKYSLATPNQINVNDSTDSDKNYYTYSLDDSTYDSTVEYHYTTIFPLSKKKIAYGRKSNVSADTNNTKLLRNDRNETTSVPEFYMNVNDLKFNNWQKLKAFKNKNTNLKATFMTNLRSDKYSVNNHTNEYRTRMKTVKGKDIKRKISKKPTLKKVVKTKTNKNVQKANDKKHITYKNTKSTKNNNKAKSSNQQFLKKMLESFSKYNSSTKNRTKQYNTIKYLKNLFKKIVFGKKNKQKSRKYRLNKHSVFKTLCETFGPCKIRNRKELHFQIIKLTNETRQIFRNIRTIKGLLQLIGPTIKAPSKGINIVNDTQNDAIKDHRLKEDIKKLSSILRNTYPEEFLGTLTQTQIEQINYIKENTHSFIRSVGKFSKRLNEVIDTISIKKGKSKNNELHRTSRFAKNDNEHYQQSETLKVIKGALLKYNLFQNNFVNKMYKVLMSFENKLSEHIRKSYNENVNEKNMLHDEHVSNNTAVIETYAKNIINNLRKLKNLAENLDSPKARTKRELSQDDDAVEYLLMLMEYLLKQNYPLDVAPVNDGIDLLIDAIRSAPDIKPIKKKVLQYTTAMKLTTKSTKAPNISNQTESKLVSEKAYKENSSITKEEDNGTKFINHFEYSEDDADEEDQSDNKTVSVSTDIYSQDVREDTTELAYYNQDNNETANAKYVTNTNTEPMIVKNNKQLQNLDERDEDFIENVKKDEKQTEPRQTGGTVGNDNNDSKYEFNSDANEDIETTSSTVGAETDIEPETTSSPTNNNSQEITEFIKNVKMKGYPAASDISASDNDKKIDWIDLAYDEEIREATKMKFKDLKKRTTEAAPTITNKMSPKSHIVPVDNISTISKEINNEKDKKKNKVEDILRKKQMDLLNSLDYGSKTAVDDVEVKEVTQGETDDVFPMYFV